MAMRIWHQSFTVLENLPAYEAALQAHMQRVCRPGTEVMLHGMHPDTHTTNDRGGAESGELFYRFTTARAGGRTLAFVSS